MLNSHAREILVRACGFCTPLIVPAPALPRPKSIDVSGLGFVDAGDGVATFCGGGTVGLRRFQFGNTRIIWPHRIICRADNPIVVFICPGAIELYIE